MQVSTQGVLDAHKYVLQQAQQIASIAKQHNNNIKVQVSGSAGHNNQAMGDQDLQMSAAVDAVLPQLRYKAVRCHVTQGC